MSSTEPRDQLATDLTAALADNIEPPCCDECTHLPLLGGYLDAGDGAKKLLGRGWRPPPRVIETAEELDALPAGSIAINPEEPEQAHRKVETGYWWTTGYPLSVTSGELLLWCDGAATVLHEPEEAR